MNTLIKLGILFVGLGLVATEGYGAVPNASGGFQSYKKGAQGHPGWKGPPIHVDPPVHHPHPLPKQGNGNHNGNGNGNKNGNGNTNKNGNSNTNDNTLVNKNNINIKIDLGKQHGKNGSNGTNGTNGTNGLNGRNRFNGLNGGFGNGFNDGLGGGFGGSPTFGGGSYSPTGGSYSYNPSYDFSGSGYGMTGGFSGNGLASVAPPLPAANFDENNPDTAWVTLDLPHEQSEVWLNGVKMPHKGLVRKYVTPPLQKGLVYNYDVKVQWPGKNGQKNNYNATLQFKAGDEILHKVPAGEPQANGAAPLPNQVKDPVDEEKRLAQRLDWAKTLIKEGKAAKAKERLQEIFEKSPDSPTGKAAKELLDSLK